MMMIQTKKFDGPRAIDDDNDSSNRPPTLEELAGIAWENNSGHASAINNATARPVPTRGTSSKSLSAEDKKAKKSKKNRNRSMDFISNFMNDEHKKNDEIQKIPRSPSMGRPSSSSTASSQGAQIGGLKISGKSNKVSPNSNKGPPLKIEVKSSSSSRAPGALRSSLNIPRVPILEESPSPQQQHTPGYNRSASADAASHLEELQELQEDLRLMRQQQHQPPPKSPARSSKSTSNYQSSHFKHLKPQQHQTVHRHRPLGEGNAPTDMLNDSDTCVVTMPEQEFQDELSKFELIAWRSKQRNNNNLQSTSTYQQRDTDNYPLPPALSKTTSVAPRQANPTVPSSSASTKSQGSNSNDSKKRETRRRVPSSSASTKSQGSNSNNSKKRETRRRSPHPVRGFTDPSLAAKQQKSAASSSDAAVEGKGDTGSSGALDSLDNGHQQQHSKRPSQFSVDSHHSIDSLDAQKLQTAEQLRDLIVMMQAEFQKLRSAKADAEMKAQSLETNLVSSQQERDAEFIKMTEEIDRLKHTAHQAKVKYENVQMKVDLIEKDNAKMKKEWSRVMKEKLAVEERCEILENENRKLKKLLGKPGSNSNILRGSVGSEKTTATAASSSSSNKAVSSPRRTAGRQQSREVGETKTRSRSADGISEMLHVLRDSSAQAGSSSGGGMSSPIKGSASTSSSSRRYGTPPPINPALESIFNATFSKTPSSSSSNQQQQQSSRYTQSVHVRPVGRLSSSSSSSNDKPSHQSYPKAPASWHGGKKRGPSARKMPAPPLVSGGGGNHSSNSVVGGSDNNSTTTNTTSVFQVPTSRPHLAAQSSWRSTDYQKRGSSSTASTGRSSLTTLRDATLAAMIEMDDENDIDFSNSGSPSLDGMVVMMQNMMEGKLGGHLDDTDASARSGPW